MCEKVECCTNAVALLVTFEKHQIPSELLLNKGVNVKIKHLSLHKCSALNGSSPTLQKRTSTADVLKLTANL